jgi:hypothetical protein
MEWLIDDIDQNGIAASVVQAEQRPTPEFVGSSSRTCP